MKRGIFTVPLEASVLGSVGGAAGDNPMPEVAVGVANVDWAAAEVAGEAGCVAGVGDEVELEAGEVPWIVDESGVSLEVEVGAGVVAMENVDGVKGEVESEVVVGIAVETEVVFDFGEVSGTVTVAEVVGVAGVVVEIVEDVENVGAEDLAGLLTVAVVVAGVVVAPEPDEAVAAGVL